MQDKSRQFLSIIINDHYFGLEIGNIVEIMMPPKPSVAADTFSEMGKTIFYKGMHIPLISLERQLFDTQITKSEDYRIVIVDINKKIAALRVDSAEEILYINKENIQPLGSQIPGLNSELLENKITSEEKTLYLLSAERLAETVAAGKS
jgi:chemotaxis signal transduction protein